MPSIRKEKTWCLGWKLLKTEETLLFSVTTSWSYIPAAAPQDSRETSNLSRYALELISTPPQQIDLYLFSFFVSVFLMNESFNPFTTNDDNYMDRIDSHDPDVSFFNRFNRESNSCNYYNADEFHMLTGNLTSNSNVFSTIHLNIRRIMINLCISCQR